MRRARGKHLKTCPECGQEFYGRLNSIYCPPYCKQDFNNAKAKLKNTALKKESDRLRLCRKALDHMYSIYGNSKFPFNEILIVGFDINALVHRVGIPNREGVWLQICEYAMLHSSDDKVELIKLDNDL